MFGGLGTYGTRCGPVRFMVSNWVLSIGGYGRMGGVPFHTERFRSARVACILDLELTVSGMSVAN